MTGGAELGVTAGVVSECDAEGLDNVVELLAVLACSSVGNGLLGLNMP